MPKFDNFALYGTGTGIGTCTVLICYLMWYQNLIILRSLVLVPVPYVFVYAPKFDHFALYGIGRVPVSYKFVYVGTKIYNFAIYGTGSGTYLFMCQ